MEIKKGKVKPVLEKRFSGKFRIGLKNDL